MAALPESLCDHSRPGLRRLTANPLASRISGIITGPTATVHGPADRTGCPSQAATSEAPSMSAAAAASGIALPLCIAGMITPALRGRVMALIVGTAFAATIAHFIMQGNF
jgi:hypothetical protein